MNAVIGLLGAAAVGALCTLIVTWWLNRNNASRTARRDTYVELLTMLKAAARVQDSTIFNPDAKIPDVVADDRIDAFNARIELDCSADVRELASKAFGLASRFNLSHVMRTPIDVDEHGLYSHRFDLVRGVDEGIANMRMRIALGAIHDEFKKIVDQLSSQIRREVHGASRG